MRAWKLTRSVNALIEGLYALIELASYSSIYKQIVVSTNQISKKWNTYISIKQKRYISTKKYIKIL